MNFGLIIIGDEILSGKRQDKHMSRVIEMLAQRGLALSWAQYLGDDPERITAALRLAFASGDVVFSCGGIGATPDDHTRECAGRALGVEMALHPQARDLIMERVRTMAAEQGWSADPAHPDTVNRLAMGIFPVGADILPNPYNKIPGFSVGDVHFVPGFPVMAHPMIESLLDGRYRHLHGGQAQREQSVIVYGSMESALTPLMVEIEALFPGIKVFSLPSVDHPEYGRHIELGVKGTPQAVTGAYAALLQGLHAHGAQIGPEMVRS